MSARARKTPSRTPQPGQTGTSTPTPAGRSASPLSPTRHSRLVEKAELQNLNDRLACYIDRVRNLESENSRLTVEVHSAHETVTREVSKIKSMYDLELSDARKLLDETAREKAKLEIDTKRLWEENDELKTRLDKKTKELTVAESSSRLYESRYNDLNSKYHTSAQDRKKALDELKDVEKENERLRKQLDELRKHLENETLARVDLENTVQSLKEELTFKDQIHTQELTETRSRRQVEISEIDGRLSEQYEAKLQKSLHELRTQYENQMRQNRDEIQMLYENKMKNLQNAANRNSTLTSSVTEELRTARSTIDNLSSLVNELEASKNALAARVRDLEKMMSDERSRHIDEVAQLESELQRLRDEMQLQLQEYQDLMDIKVSLDLEIAAYDKLLRGEEFRLNITPSTQNTASASTLSQSFRSGRPTPVRRTPTRNPSEGGIKRKRIVLDETEDRNLSEYSVTASSKGVIEIVESDAEGRFVKLRNKSDKEINIGGWQLQRSVGTNETAFKFHRSVKIDGGAIITVWSSDAGVTHEPPTNIVMKQQKWFVGDNMRTVLTNGDGEDMATSERVKQNISSHASRHRSSGGSSYSAIGAGEDIYHQQQDVDVDDSQSKENCAIM